MQERCYVGFLKLAGSLPSVIHDPFAVDSTGGLPDPWEAELMARALFLCVDVEQRRPSGASPGGLEELLRPLLDTLSRLGPNVYLPLRKADKSLQLLLRLLQLRKTPGSSDPQAQKGVSRHWLYYTAFVLQPLMRMQGLLKRVL